MLDGISFFLVEAAAFDADCVDEEGGEGFGHFDLGAVWGERFGLRVG